MADREPVRLFTDGSCSGNPGPGGWAALLRRGDGTETELSGGERETTNNRMELKAAIEGLKSLKEPCRVVLTSDSRYLVDAVSRGWLGAWRASGWKKADGSPVRNADLWRELLPLLDVHDVLFRWIRGHAGHPENERCDALAVAETEKAGVGRRSVYADNAAVTRVSPRALSAMLPWLRGHCGDPAGLYSAAREARLAAENARERVAAALGASPGEIVFTSGGTESVERALRGAARILRARGKTHLIISAFEHRAVLDSCAALEREGFEVTRLPVTPDGFVTAGSLRAALRNDTGLVSVMTANDMTGTIQPVRELAAAAHAGGALFHTDAAQAVGRIPVDVRELDADLLSLSGRKFHGPGGVGALYVRRGVLPDGPPGGPGEVRRDGTDCPALLAGLGEAITEAAGTLGTAVPRLTALRNRLIDGLLALPGVRLNGDRDRRLPGHANLSFEGIAGEDLVRRLDEEGIAASTGSARADGTPGTDRGSLRLVLSDETTGEDVRYLLERIPPAVAGLRARP